jgi:chloramphenicol 3-O-phosphotransferase
MPPEPEPAVYLITGIQAAGKSTVAQALAQRLPHSVHVRGDLFRRMIVNGRAEPTPPLTDAATRQLRLRYALAATVTDAYLRAGFSVVVQDILLGDELVRMTGLIRSRPLYVVVLVPDRATVAAREQRRAKKAYGEWTVDALDRSLRDQTPRIGLWLDNSAQTPDETVAEILARARAEAAVG